MALSISALAPSSQTSHPKNNFFVIQNLASVEIDQTIFLLSENYCVKDSFEFESG